MTGEADIDFEGGNSIDTFKREKQSFCFEVLVGFDLGCCVFLPLSPTLCTLCYDYEWDIIA